MGKARVLGSKAVLKVLNPVDQSEIQVGEVDKFTATSQAEVKKSQPLGQGYITSQQVFKGWELSLEAGKVDWKMALEIVAANDLQTVQTGRSAQYSVTQTITYYDGSIETWLYKDVTFYGYEMSAESAEEEVKESIKGFSGRERELINSTGAQNADAVATVSSFAAILAHIQNTEQWGQSIQSYVTTDNFSDPSSGGTGNP